MKKVSIAVLIIYAFTLYIPAVAQIKELQGDISLSGAFALYPMAVKWAEEFKKCILK
ncbi:MAG: hypothetical protein LUD15_01360 [Bacteroides sp.]|nr:hypothetical protein [Bacteroides sp.]